MKYSVGQKVKIRSLEWYRNNVNRYGIIECGKYEFFEPMNEYCGKVVTIKRIDDDNYRIDADKGAFCWTDEMIEGLVEDTDERLLESAADAWKKVDEMMEARYQKEKKYYDGEQWSTEFECPDGYIFKDESGNVINAQKIVLEKKKKEYPKTYEDCKMHALLGVGYNRALLLVKLEKLLTCRDAYWKIAGEEMGLGKPWEPSGNEDCFVISRSCGEVFLYESAGDNEPFEFPTPEMRDAFYENFKELIEQCKELL